ncbi:diphthine--ammonia ligase [Filobacillus milosensis]|uniref:Diphthine--ammonia ligase n=1 Tax=Filobacillus milosensis TaxID=94137 RepID=A0A4Y8IGI4_9BACI|nr:diphthine--ammonia ligase [Filobacillus milosensis]TFB14267.1 diphthine--ammonia ligase [Filobacillus milosensis]
MNKVMVSFSSGKDSMLTLHRLINNPDYSVEYLLITLSEEFKRSSIHGIREELIDLQAQSLGFPIKKVYLPKNCTNNIYEEKMAQVMSEAENAGMTHVAFGDIFLEDIRSYREEKLASGHIKPIFPLWGTNTTRLMDEFLELGYQTMITTIDPNKVPRKFLGKVIDQKLLDSFPKEVDPCGENGEFHTFVIDGPLFSKPLPVKTTNNQVDEEFYTYQDLIIQKSN